MEVSLQRCLIMRSINIIWEILFLLSSFWMNHTDFLFLWEIVKPLQYFLFLGAFYHFILLLFTVVATHRVNRGASQPYKWIKPLSFSTEKLKKATNEFFVDGQLNGLIQHMDAAKKKIKKRSHLGTIIF